MNKKIFKFDLFHTNEKKIIVTLQQQFTKKFITEIHNDTQFCKHETQQLASKVGELSVYLSRCISC